MSAQSSMGVDVGGTFTDLAWWDGTGLRTAKISSTSDQSVAVLEGALDLLDGASVQGFLHGTTVATNALLERRGARVAFVTTEGFADAIEIARQDRPSLYDSFADRAAPLVERDARFEIRRVDEESEWTDEELGDLARRIDEAEPDAVAVSLLYGYAHPAQERRIREVLGTARPVSISSEVVREFREYERASTTIINAFLSPETASYLAHLRDAVGRAGLPHDVMVMRSSGGLIPIARAARLPVAILLSGPAGGVVASAAIGEALGRSRLISFDMGGTSTDVCRIEGGIPEVLYERTIEGLAVRMPSVAIHTVGAGGGSIGWIDAGGALRVGPQSAGASPGPASYGRGGVEPAVTDANLELGRIGPNNRLAGTVELDPHAAYEALTGVGAHLGLDSVATALGMVEVVEAHMERAIRRVSVEEGADPRGSTLIAFGGAGGLHATALARRLEMAGVVVPPYAGVFSAFGLLLSPPRVDVAGSVTIEAATASVLDEQLARLTEEAASAFRADTGQEHTELRLVVDARYVGQAHETPVPVEPGIGWAAVQERFHRAHHRRNGFSRPQDPVEVVTVRAAAVGTPTVTLSDLPEVVPVGEPRREPRPVVGLDRPEDSDLVDVWWRPALAPGTEIVGPAVVEEAEATTYVGVGERLTVHESGALEVEW